MPRVPSQLLILALASLFLVVGTSFALPNVTLHGRVVDASGAVIPGASVSVYSSGGVPVSSATANAEGKFSLKDLPAGRYELVARREGLDPASLPIDATSGDPGELVLTLRVGMVTSSVTVTASRGLPEDALSVPHGLSLVDAGQRLTRPSMILPQVFREEPGVHVQQTTAHQGAVLIRGLTGQQVLHLIDGVRFNNSTFRPGPNQYLAAVDPGFADRMEISRGPNAMQYGSDSLGGTINLLPPRPFSVAGRAQFHGELSPFFRSADLAGGSSLRLSYGTEKMHILGGGAARRAQDLRAGKGMDSHAAVTRFLGLPAGVLGDRLQDTAFTQWAAYLRFFANLGRSQTLALTYHRGEPLGGRRYDQLNGGNGNLINSFSPQVLDFFYARYEKQALGWLDSLSGTFSYNRQRDDRRFQGGSGNPLAAITSENNVTSVFGYQGQGTTHFGRHHILLFGGEIYDEYIGSAAQTLNPSTGVTATVRARFPDGSRYSSYGLFAQHSSEWFASRLRTQAGIRASGIRFRTFAAKNPVLGGIPSVPDFSSTLKDVTFQAGASYRIFQPVTIFLSLSRGFRAPNTTDYSSVGLSSNGFEVSPEQAARAGGFIGSSAGSTAVSTGRRASELEPEALWDAEGGVRLHAGRVSGSFNLFQYHLKDFITKRTLILPAGAAGQSIGGAAIVTQLASGAVITAQDPRPVITRANTGRVRIRGFEAEARVKMTSSLLFSTNISYLRGVDREAGGSPDIEGGLPPLQGFAALRWQPAGRAWWVETYSQWSDQQARLSSIELADQRIGAIRSRSSIAAYFNNGAVARGLVQAGVLLPTGETLAQVQDRVLGAGVASAAMFTRSPGFATVNVRGGYRAGEHSEFVWVLENVLDKNYRTHGSGVDSAGRNLQVTYVVRF
ncbi:MAG: TonB-dependent receptor [Acidobacteria bacterium]|nr:TonB-dependent receptor [Acidobacteriota bacterium]MBI3664183.1 TonB-dependent receptor [Acidobacteriota bacterium]